MACDEALVLQWVAGLADRHANLVNLSDNHNDRVCFIAAHTAVVYDKRTRKQTLLQGHRNAISCVAATEDRSLLVTADEGPDEPLLVFWDPTSCRPLRVLRRPHARGVSALALSPDGSQLATLSAVAPGSSDVQELSLWDLQPLQAGLSSSATSTSTSSSSSTDTSMQPAATAEVPTGDVQGRLCYNPSDPGELMSNGRRRTYFWRSQLPAAALISYFSPPLRAADFRQDVSDFVASCFVPGSTQALTSTTDGSVVVWDEAGPAMRCGEPHNGSSAAAAATTTRRAVKVMRLHGASIHHLSSVGGLVVTGGADGLVRMYDPVLRLCAWFEDLDAGPVSAVSFATRGGGRAAAAGMQGDRLVAPAFMVSTSAGKLLAVQPETFNNAPDPCCPSGGELLLEAPGGGIADLAAHPLLPQLLLLDSGSRRLLRWDLASHTSIGAKALSGEYAPQRLALSWDGRLVALGCGGGHVVLLQGDSLEEVAVLRHTRAPITRLCVSLSSSLVAAADEAGTVLLYGLLTSSGAFPRWDLVGKLAGAHTGAVVGLHFGEAPSGQTRLFSAGADGRLREYDGRHQAATKCASGALRVAAAADVAPRSGGATPSCMCFAPPLPYFSHNSLDTLLLIADDGYKIRPFNPDTGAACATYLGPTFGGPLSKLLPFRCGADGGSTWLAYSTAQQVVGLIAWPLSGNPRHSMGVIAHPGEVKALALSYNGSKLITLDAQGVMMVWDVSTSALRAQSSSAMQLPWEAGAAAADSDWSQLVADPVQLEELKDYFCYAELRAQQQQRQQEQPQASAGAHRLTGRVPVSLLPDLMRAAGYYPAAADVDALLAHVRFLAGVTPQQQRQKQPGSSSDNNDDPAATATADAAASRPSSSSSKHHQHQQEDDGAAADWEDGGSQADSVDFSTFLMLYANHRPVADASQAQIEEAFRALGADTAAGALPVRQLLALLQQEGDALGEEELQRALQVLTGSPGLDADYVDARSFATEVLGFEVVA